MSTIKGWADVELDNLNQVSKPYAQLPPMVAQPILDHVTYPPGCTGVYPIGMQQPDQYWYQSIDVYIPSSEYVSLSGVFGISLVGQLDPIDDVWEGLFLSHPRPGFGGSSIVHGLIHKPSGFPGQIAQHPLGTIPWLKLDDWGTIEAWFDPVNGIKMDARDVLGPTAVFSWDISNAYLQRTGRAGFDNISPPVVVEHCQYDNWILDIR
jgi:hypothetical protein